MDNVYAITIAGSSVPSKIPQAGFFSIRSGQVKSDKRERNKENISEENGLKSAYNYTCLFNQLFDIILEIHLSLGCACTMKNTVIKPSFLVWKFCGKVQFSHSFGRTALKLCRNSAFPQDFHSRKLSEITVSFAVLRGFKR